jgi:hypothetical protein
VPHTASQHPASQQEVLSVQSASVQQAVSFALLLLSAEGVNADTAMVIVTSAAVPRSAFFMILCF